MDMAKKHQDIQHKVVLAGAYLVGIGVFIWALGGVLSRWAPQPGVQRLGITLFGIGVLASQIKADLRQRKNQVEFLLFQLLSMTGVVLSFHSELMTQGFFIFLWLAYFLFWLFARGGRDILSAARASLNRRIQAYREIAKTVE